MAAQSCIGLQACGLPCSSRHRGSSARQCHAAPARLNRTRSAGVRASASPSQFISGLTQPHPNAACVLVAPSGAAITSAHQHAQGTTPAEVLAASQAREAARGSTAYLNLETGDCHGDESAVAALVAAGVQRVVVGLRHPLAHLRNKALDAYSNAGLDVAVLGDTPLHPSLAPTAAEQALLDCLAANEALLHRAVLKRPLSILKYAMTLDGKIATAMGHSAWVSSTTSRARVFQTRAHSDVVIVGGNTVRRDNPRLTTRQEGGHTPARMVMSRTLDLPLDANLWEVDSAPTIVMTQRGARGSFQAHLRSRGVEVVEFDFLTPENVADYCYERGFLQCFWECGGTLAAPAIASGVVHKVMAFVAPKIIGGARAPTPVGELGNVEMTQAVNLVDSKWEQMGPDMMMQGYLPSSGGLLALESALSYPGHKAAAAGGLTSSATSSSSSSSSSAGGSSSSWQHASSAAPAGSAGSSSSSRPSNQVQRNRDGQPRVITFYKAWDEWGSFSNFSPHPITMPCQATGSSSSSSNPSSSSRSSSSQQVWASVEHYYQAQKFAGNSSTEAAALVASIAAAASPEEAARIGRRAERQQPQLLTPDWAQVKQGVMLDALRAKFRAHAGPRAMLLSTCGDAGAGVAAAELVEASPHDMFWGQGYYGGGRNQLGQLLMQVREEFAQEQGLVSGSSGGGSQHQGQPDLQLVAQMSSSNGRRQQQQQQSSSAGRMPPPVASVSS